MRNLSALIAGLLFGFGLAASGMTDTQKVIGFLDIFGNWDPDLAFVMGAAVITAAIGFRVIFGKLNKPLFESKFSLPTAKQIDLKLLGGAAVFGIGWGLYGYCPGPAISSVIYLSPTTYLFLVTMIIGLALGNYLSQKIKS